MNIGVDIDGVLTNDDEYILDCSTKYMVDNNLSINFKNPYGYEIENKFDLSEEENKKYREKYLKEYVIHEPARKFAAEVLKKLKEEGHQIYIITSRRYSTRNSLLGLKMQKAVKRWLRKNGIVYDEIYFSADKTIPITNLKIDIMIEDSPNTIPIFQKITHVYCYDCRYNQELKESGSLTKVFSWYDIYQKIQLMSCGNSAL